MLCNEKLPQWEAHVPQLEKAHMQQQRPSTDKNKLNKLLKKVDMKTAFTQHTL